MGKQKSVVMAFDISSKKTGWCVFRNGKLRVNSKTVGTIEPSPKLSLSEKLVYFREELLRLFERVQPTQVVLENVYVRFVGAAIVLARFSGVAMEVVQATMGYPATLITATRARSLLGAGRNKQAAFDYVVKRYNLDWEFDEYNDVTDSIIVALAIVSKVP